MESSLNQTEFYFTAKKESNHYVVYDSESSAQRDHNVFHRMADPPEGVPIQVLEGRWT